MPSSNEKWIVRRNHLKSSFEALYRDVAAHFGLPPSIVWILYTLMDAEGELAQRNLGEEWGLPKQTVNSAIQHLNRDGCLTLAVIPGTRNRKSIHLTEQGRALAEKTTRLLAQAEERAAAHLTEEEKRQYIALSEKYYRALLEETRRIRNSDREG